MGTVIVREGILEAVGNDEDSNVENNRSYKYVKWHEKT